MAAKRKKITIINWKGIIGVYLLGYILLSALAIAPNYRNIIPLRIIAQLATNAVLLISLGLYI